MATTTDITRIGVAWQRLRHPAPPPPPPPEGVRLGETELHEPVIVPTPTRSKASSVLLLGSSGCGKTTLMARLLLCEQQAALRKGRVPAAVFLCDPKGDVADYLLAALAAECPSALERVIWLDPFERRRPGFAFNLALLRLEDVSADEKAWLLAGLTNTVSTAVGSAAHLGQGARQMELSALLLGATLTSKHAAASPVWAVDALTLGPKGIKALAQQTTVPKYREALLGLYVGDELRASTLSRLRLFAAATETIEAMSAAAGCLDFESCIAPGAITIVSLKSPPAGNSMLVRLWANLIVRLAFERAMMRESAQEGPLVRFVIDELPLVSDTTHECLERGLAVGRSKGLSWVLASQTLKQLEVNGSDLLVQLVLSQVPWRAVGRLPAREAELCAREQAPGPGIDESASELRARLAGAIVNLQDREFISLRAAARQRFVADPVDMERWLKAASDRSAEIEKLKQKLWLPDGLPPRVRLSELIEPTRKGRRQKPAGEPPPTPGGEPPPPESRWG